MGAAQGMPDAVLVAGPPCVDVVRISRGRSHFCHLGHPRPGMPMRAGNMQSSKNGEEHGIFVAMSAMHGGDEFMRRWRVAETAEYLVSRQYAKATLQFPDPLLPEATRVAVTLQDYCKELNHDVQVRHGMTCDKPAPQQGQT